MQQRVQKNQPIKKVCKAGAAITCTPKSISKLKIAETRRKIVITEALQRLPSPPRGANLVGVLQKYTSLNGHCPHPRPLSTQKRGEGCLYPTSKPAITSDRSQNDRLEDQNSGSPLQPQVGEGPGVRAKLNSNQTPTRLARGEGSGMR